ncbi:hypothetical protein TGP89_356900 [Toxoplasma gondii p89]|uniref:Uncharacterized protein n=1 Tax=Toxoplasma gondii p89 TaxID=943119 RepID=A0A086J9U5_TOXGO|nr:hypothetical protein TGP89_356900 [Toxoplasma gondii p89]
MQSSANLYSCSALPSVFAPKIVGMEQARTPGGPQGPPQSPHGVEGEERRVGGRSWSRRQKESKGNGELGESKKCVETGRKGRNGGLAFPLYACQKHRDLGARGGRNEEKDEEQGEGEERRERRKEKKRKNTGKTHKKNARVSQGIVSSLIVGPGDTAAGGAKA